jgi:hypothetical protein
LLTRLCWLTSTLLACALLTLATASSAFALATWLPPQDLTTSGGISGTEQQLVTSPGGTIGAVWGASASGATVLDAALKRPGEGVHTANASAAITGAGEPQMAVNDRGDAIIVFTGYAPGGTSREVWAVYQGPSDSSWTAPERVSSGAEDGSMPRVAIDPNGNAVVVYVPGGNQGPGKVRYRAADGTWAALQTIAIAAGLPTVTSASSIDVGVDATGAASVVFTGSGYGWHVSRTAGADGALTDAIWGPHGYAARPYERIGRVRVSPRGDVLAWFVFCDAPSTSCDIWTETRAAGTAYFGTMTFASTAYSDDAVTFGVANSAYATGVYQGLSGGQPAALTVKYNGSLNTWQTYWPAAPVASNYNVAIGTGGQTAAIAWWAGSPSAVSVANFNGNNWSTILSSYDSGSKPAIGIANGNDIALFWRHVTAGGPDRPYLRLFDVAPPSGTVSVPATGEVGQPVSMSASYTDAMSSVAGYSWNFGDGSAAGTGATVSHTFTSLGQKSVTVTVKDSVNNSSTSAAQMITISDTTAPETVLDSQPAAVTKTDPVIAFHANDNAATAPSYTCTLDGSPFANCNSPVTLSGLAEGEHTFAVAAVDASNNADATPASAVFTIDRTPPDTQVTSAVSPTTAAHPEIEFGTVAVDPGATFRCSVNNSSWVSCESPFDLATYGEGDIAVRVAAVDAAGNVDPTPAEATIHVDRTGPQVSVTNAPLAASRATRAEFDFTSGASDLDRFVCVVDGVTADPCVSPLTFGVSEGTHSVEISGIDALGNAGPPFESTFRSDLTAPIVTFSDPAAGATTSATPGFAGTAGNALGDLAHVDVVISAGETVVQQKTATVSANHWGLAADALPPGTYTASACQYDDAGNFTCVTRTFSVAVPPSEPEAPPAPVKPGPLPSLEPLITGEQPVLQPAANPPVPAPVATKAALASLITFLQKNGLKTLKETTGGASVSAPGPGVIIQQVTASVSAAKRKPVLLAQGKRNFAAAGNGQIKLVPTAAGRKLAKKSKRLRVTVVTTFSPVGGKPYSVKQAVTLKASR